VSLPDDVGVRLTRATKRYVSREVSHAPGRRRGLVETVALQDVSLSVRRGESLGILGPNGAGKTTLLRLVAGVTAPTQGTVEVRGPVVGLLGASAGFQWSMSARENAILTAAFHGTSRRESLGRMAEVLAYADLAEHADLPISRYSDGMRFRLGFSIAIHLPHRAFVSDEALATADAAFRRRAHESLRADQRGGGVLLVASHDIESLLALTDRACRLEAGRVADEGDTAAVLGRAPAAPAPEKSRAASEGVG
jgi:ABC-type polysaccharide/polyol phosphate transport system ATPase subunit